MFTSVIHRIILGVSIAVLAVPGSGRGADTEQATRSETAVPYGDLDLTKAKSQAILTNRVKIAVAEVCGLEGRWYADQVRVRSCREATMRSAEAQISEAVRRAELRASVTITANESPSSYETAMLIRPLQP